MHPKLHLKKLLNSHVKMKSNNVPLGCCNLLIGVALNVPLPFTTNWMCAKKHPSSLRGQEIME